MVDKKRKIEFKKKLRAQKLSERSKEVKADLFIRTFLNLCYRGSGMRRAAPELQHGLQRKDALGVLLSPSSPPLLHRLDWWRWALRLEMQMLVFIWFTLFCWTKTLNPNLIDPHTCLSHCTESIKRFHLDCSGGRAAMTSLQAPASLQQTHKSGLMVVLNWAGRLSAGPRMSLLFQLYLPSSSGLQ